jgi:Holliday junction resolvase RusA-like endonuclease
MEDIDNSVNNINDCTLPYNLSANEEDMIEDDELLTQLVVSTQYASHKTLRRSIKP